MAHSLPLLNRSFRMRDYLAAAKGLNVVKSVHVEADVDEPFMLDETRHLLALADQGDNPSKALWLAVDPRASISNPIWTRSQVIPA